VEAVVVPADLDENEADDVKKKPPDRSQAIKGPAS